MGYAIEVSVGAIVDTSCSSHGLSSSLRNAAANCASPRNSRFFFDVGVAVIIDVSPRPPERRAGTPCPCRRTAAEAAARPPGAMHSRAECPPPHWSLADLPLVRHEEPVRQLAVAIAEREPLARLDVVRRWSRSRSLPPPCSPTRYKDAGRRVVLVRNPILTNREHRTPEVSSLETLVKKTSKM